MRARALMAVPLVVALLLPACGSRSCADVADDLGAALQDALDTAAELTAADLQTEGEPIPPFLQELQTRATELQAEAEELGCSDEAMEQLVAARIEELEAEPGTVAEILLQSLRDDEFFTDGREAPVDAPPSPDGAGTTEGG